MTEEVKEQPTPIPEKRLFSEGRGQYGLVDGAKVYYFTFPLNNNIEDNFAAISYLKDKVIEILQAKAKEEKAKEEKAVEVTEEVKEEKPKKDK